MFPCSSATLLIHIALSCYILRDRAGELFTGSESISMPLLTILSWYATDDIVEDIDMSLDVFLLVKEFISLTSLKLSGAGPARMSIPMLFEESTVGNAKACELDVVDELKFEEKNNLFAMFPIGTTMQDGGKRKRSDVITLTLTLSSKN